MLQERCISAPNAVQNWNMRAAASCAGSAAIQSADNPFIIHKLKNETSYTCMKSHFLLFRVAIEVCFLTHESLKIQFLFLQGYPDQKDVLFS